MNATETPPVVPVAPPVAVIATSRRGSSRPPRNVMPPPTGSQLVEGISVDGTPHDIMLRVAKVSGSTYGRWSRIVSHVAVKSAFVSDYTAHREKYESEHGKKAGCQISYFRALCPSIPDKEYNKVSEYRALKYAYDLAFPKAKPAPRAAGNATPTTDDGKPAVQSPDGQVSAADAFRLSRKWSSYTLFSGIQQAIIAVLLSDIGRKGLTPKWLAATVQERTAKMHLDAAVGEEVYIASCALLFGVGLDEFSPTKAVKIDWPVDNE